MNRLPPNLPTLLRAAGLRVVVIDGWQSRGRPASTGGFDPVGVLWHHTGANNGGKSYAEWLAKVGRSDLPAPLCHLSIGRDGTVYVCAAGRANHAGKAKPSGTVAGGDGNRLYVGVECQNNGTEGWKALQYDAMVATGAVLARLLGTSVQTQRGHKETSVTGKWDPGHLDMDAFRADIAKALAGKPTPTPEPKANAVQAARAKLRAALDDADAAVKSLREDSGSKRKVVHQRATEIGKHLTAARAIYRKGPTS